MTPLPHHQRQKSSWRLAKKLPKGAKVHFHTMKTNSKEVYFVKGTYLRSFSKPLIDFGLWFNQLLRQVPHHLCVLQRLVSQNSYSTYRVSFSCFSSPLQASAASSQNLLFLSASSFFQSLCPGQPLSTGR